MQQAFPITRLRLTGSRSRDSYQRHGKITRTALAVFMLGMAAGLLSGCPEDPLGPDNRLALIAFGRCDDQQALQLADLAIARGDAHHIQRALMLKAAILRDRGDTSEAEAIYPELAKAWTAARKSELKTSRRERDISILIDIAHNERRANDLPTDCGR